MKNMTYDDWKLAGYQVQKGAKSCGRNKDGKALFSRDQVQAAIDKPGGECPKCGYWGAACKCNLSGD